MVSIDSALIELERSLGSGRVLTDPDLLASYATDESEVPPHPPQAAIRVQDERQVAAALKICSEHGVPVTPRAGGTGRTGGAVPLAGGVVLAFEHMRAIKGIEDDDLIAVVEPGVITGELHAAVEERGLFYPPDPNSLAGCTLAGNVAENAGGPRALRYGCTRDYVLGMRVVTADGTQLAVGKRTPKGVTGYDLTSLLVGSEGTLAITTEITLKLLPKPEAIGTLLAFLPDLDAAGRAVSAVIRSGLLPRCMELLDEATLAIVRSSAGLPIPQNTRALLLVELDGDQVALDAQLERAGNALVEAGALDVLMARHGGERAQLWAARRELSRALRASAQFKLAEDIVVPRSKIPALIGAAQRISERFGVHMPTYGHAGDGNLHVNFLWNDPAHVERVHDAIGAVFEEVISFGGTLSGEHGIGVLKAKYLPLEQSAELIALQERVKATFDPKGILNPGKIFPGAVSRFHGAC
ncbi:MAG TPA: FAD-linked oxidase C-terminal domain-containing protein [Polyangiales bacterium]|nr:FAD-linked oxidase C-terminal domain-containing protein [Polyangiales bacterium]